VTGVQTCALPISSNAQADSSVFKQLGRPGAGSANDPMAMADEFAKSQITKSGKTATEADLAVLRVQYMTEHPGEFYQDAK
jgi:hypothetical protein